MNVKELRPFLLCHIINIMLSNGLKEKALLEGPFIYYLS